MSSCASYRLPEKGFYFQLWLKCASILPLLLQLFQFLSEGIHRKCFCCWLTVWTFKNAYKTPPCPSFSVSVSLLHVPLKRQQTEERKQKHNALYSWLSLFVEAQKNSQTLCLFTRSFDYFWGFGASFCVFCLLFYYNCLITWIWRLQKGSNQTCGAPQCDSWSFFFLSFYFYDFKQGNTPASVPHIYSNVVS